MTYNRERARAANALQKERLRSTDPEQRAWGWRGSSSKYTKLSREWFQKRLEDGVCEVAGIPFTLDVRRGPWSPSIDQIEPQGGYTEDNCRMVCEMYNRCKNNWTDEEVVKMAKALVS